MRKSYRDLPKYTYQFQTKFRNELRAKSGIMRGREFLMKDMYSFNRSEKELDEFYERAIQAYKNIYERLGIGDKTYLTFASGGMFSKFSHEFQTICETGEDHIFVSEEKKMAINDEVMQDEILESLGLSRNALKEYKSIEVGNIFKYGTRYTSELGVTYKDEKGKEKPVVFGAYGIGLGRAMGTIVEVLSDEKGIIWPAEVAPFAVHLVSITSGNEDVVKEADRLYELLRENGIDVLYDDRDSRAGEKFADSDLIGIPTRLVISEKTMSEGGIEKVDRKTGHSSFVPDSDIIELFNE